MTELNVELVHVEPGKLHADRSQVIGGSDVAAITGHSPYKTRLQVALEKLGRTPPPTVNAAMDRGTMLEPCFPGYLLREFPGAEIQRANFFLIDRARGVGCHPDFVMRLPEDEGGIYYNIQCKTIGRHAWEAGGAKPRFHDMLQTLYEGMLLGSYLGDKFRGGRLAYLVISQNDLQFHVSDPIERHPEAEARLLADVDSFWATVRAGKLPAAEYPGDAELMTMLHPPREEVEAPIDLSGDNRIQDLLIGYEAARIERKKLDDQQKAIAGEIVEKLQGATSAFAPGFRVTYKQVHRKAYTVDASDYTQLRVTSISD